MLALEIDSGPSRRALRPSSCSSPRLPCTPTSAVDAMSYSLRSGLSSSYSIPATPSSGGREQCDTGAVTPAGRFEDGKHRLDRVRPPGFPVSAFEVCAPGACLCPADRHSATGPATRHVPRLLGGTPGLVAQQRQLHGRVLAVRAGTAYRTPEDRSPRCLPDESGTSTSSAQSPRSPLCPRSRSRNNVPSSSVTTPYQSAFIYRHVTTSKRFPGNGSSAARSSENRYVHSVSLR